MTWSAISDVSTKVSKILDIAGSDANLASFASCQLDQATHALSQGFTIDPLPLPNAQLIYDLNITQALQGMARQESVEKERIRHKLTGFDPNLSPAWIAIRTQFGPDVKQISLCEIAKYLAKKRQILLDRDSKRRKSILLKWFHDHWNVIEPCMSMFKLNGDTVIITDPDVNTEQ